ncbi:MAG: myo-inosose-2 dehydratase [Tagaea sp.]|nr:myo-inosose-2 dehydratase [Tagaea sp.]
MPCPLGINPLTWTNDDMPALGADTPLETCLKEAKEAGYDGVELGNKFPRHAAKLAPIMADFRLKIVSGWYSARLLERDADAEMAAMDAHLSLLTAMGSSVMVFAETTGCVHGDKTATLDSRRKLTDAEMDLLAARMTEIAKRMRARGMRLAYHHHMGTVVETESEIDALMAKSGPEVELLLDTGHFTYAGGDPLKLARKHAKRIAHVHCKDIRKAVLDDAKRRNLSFLDSVLEGVFTVPGDGAVAYPPIFAELKRAGYGGWLVVEAEQDPAKAHPLTYARMGRRYLAETARAAGL